MEIQSLKFMGLGFRVFVFKGDFGIILAGGSWGTWDPNPHKTATKYFPSLPTNHHLNPKS